MKQSFYMIIGAAVVFAVSSCNTFIGAGRDIQTIGTGMQNAGHGKTWDGNEKPAPAPAAQSPQAYP